MSTGRRRLAITLLLPALLAGSAGCGSDDEDGNEETIPAVTAPVTTEPAPATTVAPTTTREATTTTKPPKTGGTPSYDPGKADTPENDVPPPAGSPQEAFERMCEQNPSACG
jgi:hypothetical protein